MYVGLWPWKSRVVAFARKREITGEPLNSRSQILAPNRREITGVDCTKSLTGWVQAWNQPWQDDPDTICLRKGQVAFRRQL